MTDSRHLRDKKGTEKINFDNLKFREKRREKGYSQAFLAEKIGCAPKTVNRWEDGSNTPNSTSYKLILEALELVDFDELLRPIIDAKKNYSKDRGELKIAAFDLDGTLILGGKFKYSWQSVWHHLKIDDNERRELMKRFRQHEISYNEWCKECSFIFKREGLKRTDFESICNGLSLRNGVINLLSNLKKRGILTCLISGGVDTILYEVFPTAREVFDNIYINKFIYAEDYSLRKIIPTRYDFIKKGEAIKMLQESIGCSEENTLFVGNGVNDEHMYKFANTTITFEDADEGTLSKFDIVIPGLDLNKEIMEIIQLKNSQLELDI